MAETSNNLNPKSEKLTSVITIKTKNNEFCRNLKAFEAFQRLTNNFLNPPLEDKGTKPYPNCYFETNNQDLKQKSKGA